VFCFFCPSSFFGAVKMLHFSTLEVASGRKLDLVGTLVPTRSNDIYLVTFQNNQEKLEFSPNVNIIIFFT